MADDGKPRCSDCDQPLLAPQSKKRGYCDRCRERRGEPMELTDWDRVKAAGVRVG